MNSTEYGSWHPITVEAMDWVTPNIAAALHGLLDEDGDPPQAGDLLPPLWHWLAFHSPTPQRDMAPDGHARLGRFLPPLEGSRRMFGGCRVEMLNEVRVGERLRRVSRVIDVVAKTGRSGPLTFVSVMNEIYVGITLAIREVTDLVYRQGGATAVDRGPLRAAPELEWPWATELLATPVLLFRFSALTYNAHRIHYDREYATQTEGYPGLVVHGPLQALALSELCRQHAGGRRMTSFAYRALRPTFDGAAIALRGRLDTSTGRASLVALTQDGLQTSTADAELDNE